MVSKKLPYDTNGLPYDVYMGDSRPQCRPPTFGKTIYLTERSSSHIAQCEYIGSSIELSWFNEVVLWSRLRKR